MPDRYPPPTPLRCLNIPMDKVRGRGAGRQRIREARNVPSSLSVRRPTRCLRSGRRSTSVSRFARNVRDSPVETIFRNVATRLLRRSGHLWDARNRCHCSGRCRRKTSARARTVFYPKTVKFNGLNSTASRTCMYLVDPSNMAD